MLRRDDIGSTRLPRTCRCERYDVGRNDIVDHSISPNFTPFRPTSLEFAQFHSISPISPDFTRIHSISPDFTRFTRIHRITRFHRITLDTSRFHRVSLDSLDSTGFTGFYLFTWQEKPRPWFHSAHAAPQQLAPCSPPSVHVPRPPRAASQPNRWSSRRMAAALPPFADRVGICDGSNEAQVHPLFRQML